MKILVQTTLAAGMLLGATSSSFAHGGTLDRSGCHFDSRTKVYHCHKGPSRFDNAPTDALATKSRVKHKRK